jgi:pyruvate/2-oxoacid:ferredoxin oxidoreductase beta subunit
MYEMVDGMIGKVKKIRDRKPVEEYLRMQGRFKHLFTMEGGDEEIARILLVMIQWHLLYQNQCSDLDEEILLLIRTGQNKQLRQ